MSKVLAGLLSAVFLFVGTAAFAEDMDKDDMHKAEMKHKMHAKKAHIKHKAHVKKEKAEHKMEEMKDSTDRKDIK